MLFPISRPEQTRCLFEPAVHGAFRQSLHAKVTELFDLTVVRHVVLIFLEQDLCQQAGTGDSLVDRQQGHGSNQYATHFFGSRGDVVFQAPLLADNLLDIKLAVLVLHDTCHLPANLLIEVRVEIVGSENTCSSTGRSSIMIRFFFS